MVELVSDRTGFSIQKGDRVVMTTGVWGRVLSICPPRDGQPGSVSVAIDVLLQPAQIRASWKERT